MTTRAVISIADMAEASGGPPRVIAALAGAVLGAGGDVTVVTGDDGRPVIAMPAGIDTRAVPVPGWRGYGEAVGAALDRAPAVLHDHGIWSLANQRATGAARRRGVPYLVSVHGMLDPWSVRHHAWRKRLAWAAYQRSALAGAAALVANAEPERAVLRARFPRQAVATVANGVEIPAALPAARPDSGPATVLFMSRLHRKKNLVGLVEAWALVVADPAAARWTLRIAGPDEGGHEAVVRARVAALGIGDRVEFAGSIPETGKDAAFAGVDLFVLSSFTENFGIVAAEALAYGVPVVASTGTPWSGLRDHRCGWWVGTEPAALAGALAAAIALPAAERHAMGLRGRAWVAQAFGWQAIGARMLEVYDWVRHGGRAPDCVDV